MAAPADYFQRVDLTASPGDQKFNRTNDNTREDFMDAIYNIAPTDTPFMSGIGRESCSDVFTSWLQDDLAAPVPTNAVVDGADLALSTVSPARRAGNTCQISVKGLAISGRAEAVTKAGRASEMAYQLAKKSKELKRDMEAILTGNVASATDDGNTTASTLGGLQACFRAASSGQTAVVFNGAGSTGPRANTTLVPAAMPTDGTDRALSETLLQSAILGAYSNGGSPDTLMVAPSVKGRISAYLFSSSARIASLYSDIGQKTGGVSAQAAVDVYISDFGAIKIVPNRFLGHSGTAANTSVVFLLDMGLWAVGYLRPFQTKDIAKIGDSERKQLLVDYTLIYKQEMGNAVITDLSTADMTA